jgi:DNA invertase Pin-like site-specific DNA recombinase
MGGQLIPAVAYYRVSTDQQEASIPRQREAVLAYAKVNGYHVLREYQDEGISGDATERRLGFLRMREDAGRGDFQVILCWDKDRFGRFDSIEQGYWVKPLRDVGVRLVTVAQGAIDWNSFGGRIVDAALAESKHEFLRSLSLNTTAGKIRAARGAYFCGGTVPYGFERLLLNERDEPQRRLRRGERTEKPPGWHCVLVPSENLEEIEVVRWLFRSYVERDVSCRTLANELNARGVPGPASSGKRLTRWGRQVLAEMLRNAHYVGDSDWGKSGQGKFSRAIGGEAKPVSGIPKSKLGRPRKQRNTEGLIGSTEAHEGIIDRDLWDQARAKLAARRRDRQFPRSTGYPLAGLVVCGHCGKRMHGCTNRYKNRPGRRDYRRYVCTSFNLNGPSACGYHAIREDRLLPFLVRRLQEDYLAPSKLEQLKAELLAQAATKQQADPATAARLRAKLSGLDEEIRQGARNLLRGGPHTDIVSEALTEVRQKRAQVARELEALERSLATPAGELERVVNDAITVLYQLRDRICGAEPDRLREVLKQMVSSIELYFEEEPKKKKVYHRLVRGVVKLRPQVDVSGIKECQDSTPMPTSTTSTAYLFFQSGMLAVLLRKLLLHSLFEHFFERGRGLVRPLRSRRLFPRSQEAVFTNHPIEPVSDAVVSHEQSFLRLPNRDEPSVPAPSLAPLVLLLEEQENLGIDGG